MEGWDVGNDYACIKLLGKGGYGYVVEAIHKPSGKRVAIKKMDEVFCNRSHARRILREITLLRRLKNKAVVDIIEVIEPSDPEYFSDVYVVLELADRDLKKVIESDMYLTLD
jgi:mitogen-activated protein kinase 1/3